MDCRLLIAVMLLALPAVGQRRTPVPLPKPKPQSTPLSVGIGVTRNVIYLSRNISDNSNVSGFNAHLVYGGNRLIRGTVEYNFYRTLTIAPTLYDIHAHAVEANLHFLAHFADSKAYFFPITGISYSWMTGFFTGRNDYQNLHHKYQPGTTISSRWACVNAGVGYEQFFRPLSIYAEYKMRIGIDDLGSVNIIDVVMAAGVRYNLHAPSLHRIFRGTRNRYLLHPRPAR